MMARTARISSKPKSNRHASRRTKGAAKKVNRSRCRKSSNLFDIDAGVVVALILVGINVSLKVAEAQDCAAWHCPFLALFIILGADPRKELPRALYYVFELDELPTKKDTGCSSTIGT
jgi:hypothetical protein